MTIRQFITDALAASATTIALMYALAFILPN